MKYQKQKSGKKISFPIATRKIKYLGINPNQGDKRPVLRKLHNTEEKKLRKAQTTEACTILMDWKN